MKRTIAAISLTENSANTSAITVIKSRTTNDIKMVDMGRTNIGVSFAGKIVNPPQFASTAAVILTEK